MLGVLEQYAEGRRRASHGGAAWGHSVETLEGPHLPRSVPQHGGVRVHLGHEQWHEVEQGRLVGPDSRRYSRRTTRTKRKEAEQLLADGAPLVLFYWAGAQLDWFDGLDSREQWKSIRAHVVSTEPRPKGDIEWTAGRWEDEEGHPVLVLTGHC